MDIPLDPLADYARHFQRCFRRRDQARWMEIYLRGLLDLSLRKNPESLARNLGGAEPDHTANIAQSLQNFVNQSPWDEHDLWHKHRAQQRAGRGERPLIAVIEEVGFLKQGTHSVGVQRQFWSEHGKKLNCQLAVALYAVGDEIAFPLGLRLYLPRAWTNAPHRLESAGVPESQRAPASKGQIALELLQSAWSAGLHFDLVVGRGPSSASIELHEELARREQPCLFEVSAERLVTGWETQTVVQARDLKVEPFAETRELNWASVSLPEASGPRRPWQLLSSSTNQRYYLARLGQNFGASDWQRALRSYEKASQCQQQLRSLGLDHFEGRSWRGFHHHVCLVALAHGFVNRNS